MTTSSEVADWHHKDITFWWHYATLRHGNMSYQQTTSATRHHTPNQHMPRHYLNTILRHIHIWPLIDCSTDAKCCHGNMSCQQTTTATFVIFTDFHWKSEVGCYKCSHTTSLTWTSTGYLTGISIYGDSQDQSAVQENTVQWSLTYCTSSRLVCTLHLWFGHLLDITGISIYGDLRDT